MHIVNHKGVQSFSAAVQGVKEFYFQGEQFEEKSVPALDPPGCGRGRGTSGVQQSCSVCGEGGVWAEVMVATFNVLERMVHMYSWWLGRGCSYIRNTSVAW